MHRNSSKESVPSSVKLGVRVKLGFATRGVHVRQGVGTGVLVTWTTSVGKGRDDRGEVGVPF